MSHWLRVGGIWALRPGRVDTKRDWGGLFSQSPGKIHATAPAKQAAGCTNISINLNRVKQKKNNTHTPQYSAKHVFITEQWEIFTPICVQWAVFSVITKTSHYSCCWMSAIVSVLTLWGRRHQLDKTIPARIDALDWPYSFIKCGGWRSERQPLCCSGISEGSTLQTKWHISLGKQSLVVSDTVEEQTTR